MSIPKDPTIYPLTCATRTAEAADDISAFSPRGIRQYVSIPWLSSVLRSSIARVGNALYTFGAGTGREDREVAERIEQRKTLLSFRLERVCTVPIAMHPYRYDTAMLTKPRRL
jgi:hypothetical protein